MAFEVNDVEQPRSFRWSVRGSADNHSGYSRAIIKPGPGGIHVVLLARALETPDSYQRFCRHPARQRIVSN